MIGKVILKSISYRTFTRNVRKHLPSATHKEIYREWCRELEVKVEGHHLDYDKAASRILRKRAPGAH
jgi:hypothetical protein